MTISTFPIQFDPSQGTVPRQKRKRFTGKQCLKIKVLDVLVLHFGEVIEQVGMWKSSLMKINLSSKVTDRGSVSGIRSGEVHTMCVRFLDYRNVPPLSPSEAEYAALGDAVNRFSMNSSD